MKRIVILVILILPLIVNASAEEVFDRQKNALALEELEDTGIDLEITKDISLDDGLKTLFSQAKEEVLGVFNSALVSVGIVFVIAVTTSVIEGVNKGGLTNAPNYTQIVSALAICAACAGNVNSFIAMGIEAVNNMDAFSKMLLPTLSASLAACGSPLGASARYSASLLFSNAAMVIINKLLVPLVYAYISASCVNAAIKDGNTGKIADFLQWLISGALKIIVTAFIAYISVSGFIASTGDVAGVKTVSALSGTIPIVGSALSKATGVVLSGAKIIKNSIGVYGILSVLSICISPVLVLGVNYLCFKAASAIVSPVCNSKTSELVGRIGTSYGTMLAICASCAFLLFISILSCMFALGAG